ncbi:hypothetical protein [Methylobacterium sp. V23]|uniref:Nmad2 family putative nucleotide modification protein n=1 Tax=Methylobacterium sp. V23 TaxID=2044878 RepID=UPI000CDAC58E|nr:hypothetical protein [Methylobacterium sp. V23]POR40059.1 hypothetical protein CRT23_25945 [Methylobacterium sp. V23]
MPADRPPRIYVYVVKYDLGFAPNPFGGVCTLACCKPDIRRVAQIGDWVIGMGGGALKATGRCVFAMRVTRHMTFNEYWRDPAFGSKRTQRNGTRRTLVGDNIYHHGDDGVWTQEDSVHSANDGSQDPANTRHDTQTDRLLLSDHFIYFGNAAPVVPPLILNGMGYSNRRGHRTFELAASGELVAWIEAQAGGVMNRILGDPFQFRECGKRYSKSLDKLI